MLGTVSLVALQSSEETIEKLTAQWSSCSGLIARADDTARAEKLERTRRGILVDEANGRTVPLDWDRASGRRVSTCWRRMRSIGRNNSEAIARTHFRGAGGGEDVLDAPVEGRDEHREKKRNSNRDRRLTKRAKIARERPPKEVKTLEGRGHKSEKEKESPKISQKNCVTAGLPEKEVVLQFHQEGHALARLRGSISASIASRPVTGPLTARFDR